MNCFVAPGSRSRVTNENGSRVLDLATGGRFTGDGVKWHDVVNVGDTTVAYLLVESE